MKTNQPGKSLLRKAIHSSSFNDQPLKMSPHTQLFANKFLFMPKLSRQTKQPLIGDHFEADTTMDEERCLPWNPISSEDTLDLIPVACSNSAPDTDFLAEEPDGTDPSFTDNDNYSDG